MPVKDFGIETHPCLFFDKGCVHLGRAQQNIWQRRTSRNWIRKKPLPYPLKQFIQRYLPLHGLDASMPTAHVQHTSVQTHATGWGTRSRCNPQHSCVTSNKSFHSRSESITSLRKGVLIISLCCFNDACDVYCDPHY